MNQIEIAKRIISQNGRCDGVRCEDCQAYKMYLEKGLDFCNDIFGGTEDNKCKSWFENWLKENENPMTEKIQHTKKEWVKIIEDLNWNPDVILELEEKGYIIKSELQQKVEEAEWIINQIGLIINNCTSNERIVLVWKDAKTLYEIFQLLKQSHPEFKK